MREDSRGPVESVVALRALAWTLWGADRPGWHAEAACRDYDPRWWDGSRHPHFARAVCAPCPVRRECLDDAIGWETARATRARYPSGVRAGMSGTERASLYRRLPRAVGVSGVARRRPRR